MLTDTLTRELSGVGPEDVPSEEQLKRLRSTLELQVLGTKKQDELFG